jgi:RNA recognition motif-containing protein
MTKDEEGVHSLFVGGLPKDCLESELTHIFAPFGENSARIKYAKITRQTLGEQLTT